MAETVINVAKLVDLFDRAARASGFMDFMPSPMIGHFVRQIIPSSVQNSELRADQFYKWVRQEYSVPDHIFSRVFSRVDDDLKEMGLKLILPENMTAGVDDAIKGWLKSELKEVVYADLREEMREDIRRELRGELRPEVFRELRETFEKNSGLACGQEGEHDHLPGIDAEGVEGMDELLTPIPGGDEAAVRREIVSRLEPQIREELRAKLMEAVHDELRSNLEAELRPQIEAGLRDELRDAVKEELRGTVEKKLRDELYPSLHETVCAELRAVDHSGLSGRLRGQIESEVREELRKQIWNEVRDEVKQDLRTLLKPVLEAELRAEHNLPPAPPPPSIDGFEELAASGGDECYVVTGNLETPGAGTPAPRAAQVEIKSLLSTDDQLFIIQQLRAELVPAIREKIIADLNLLQNFRAEEEEKQKRLARLDDPEYCLGRIRAFLFPEQPGLFEKIKPVIKPAEWRAVVVASEMEDRLDPERLNRTRGVIREAIKIKADIAGERDVPAHVAKAPGAPARLKSLSLMLDNADHLLDFSLQSISQLLSEILPPGSLEKPARP